MLAHENIIASMPLAAIELDPDLRVIGWNAAAEKIFGFASKEAIGQHIGFLSPENARPQADLAWNDLLAGDGDEQSIKANITKDGRTIICKWHSTSVAAADGQVLGLISFAEDITERKRAEEAMKESEQKYRDLFENAIEGITQSTPEGRYLSVNPSFAHMFGFKSPEEMLSEIDNIQYQLYSDPEDRAKLKMLLDGQEPVKNFEVECNHRDGHKVWASINGKSVRDESGKVLFYEGIIQDITERKHSQDALKESERRLADIINFLPDPTFVIDKDGKVIAWNHAIETMTGVKAKEILGKGNYEYSLLFYGQRIPILIDLVLRPQEEIHRRYDDIKMRDGTLIGEAYLPNLRGKRIYFMGTAAALYDSKGNVVGAIESMRDITDRKNADDKLYNSQQMLQLVLDTIPQRVFWKDRNFSYLGCNKSFASDVWLDHPSDIIGKNDFDLRWSDAAQMYRDGDQSVMESDTSRLNFEEIEIKPDGSQIWLRKSKVPLHDQQANVIGVLGIYEDITEHKQAEEILQHHHAHEIMEVSTPVVQLWEGVLAVPLIGTLDSERTQRITERLLNRIVETDSVFAIIDLTGVPMVDTQTGRHLIDTIAAVRLLGTQALLTGIRPEIAQTLVHLGIEMTGVVTRPSLASGLRYALKIIDHACKAENKE